jgi:hypothetical protein
MVVTTMICRPLSVCGFPNHRVGVLGIPMFRMLRFPKAQDGMFATTENSAIVIVVLESGHNIQRGIVTFTGDLRSGSVSRRSRAGLLFGEPGRQFFKLY